MLIKSFLCSLVIASTALARIEFTQPVKGTVWTAGEKAVIQWQGKDGASLSNFPLNIELIWGDSGSVITLGQLVSPRTSVGTVTFTVYKDLVSSDKYAIRANRTIYSDQFEIQNKEKGSGNPATVRLPAMETTSGAGASSPGIMMLMGAAGGLALLV